jgi:hypothetical protein
VLDLDPPSGGVVEADHVRRAQGAQLAAAGAGTGGARPHGPVAGGEPGEIERFDGALTTY